MTYSEKLLDPNWLKRRGEIKRRDGYKCRQCGEVRGQLHVHHHEYISDREPWEYADSLLITLCEKCHDKKHAPAPAQPKVNYSMADALAIQRKIWQRANA